ncbi:sucrase ferredoxin [Glaciihabitans sp. UYNi722]|uniref:sucrase ferredoxin n=1 Tax=Glaciihabitans sp. UYNi722 TaxID=3156344 RepID=UPI003396FEB2
MTVSTLLTGAIEGWIPCSDRSLERDDPLIGTAGFGERWFLVEIDGAWGEHAFVQSRLDPEAARRLVSRIEGAGIRPLAIRRTGRKADERRAQKRWRWAAIDARQGQESVRWGVADDPLELLEIPLDGSTGELSDEPVICVCTHARHDQCCAVKGRPVVTALAKLYPQQTWECSHLGGDRFAATMIVFPHGLLYGRMRADAASALIENYTAGIADPRFFRGRTSLPNAVQAAVGFASQATGDYRVDAFRYVSEQRGDATWSVTLDHDGTELVVDVVATLSEPLLSMCSAVRAAPVREFALREISPAAS